MRIIKSDNIEFLKKPCGIGLGNFDGLHIGHKMLIETLKHECIMEGINSALYTFEAHPENILRKKLINHMIISNEKKLELISNLGIDVTYFENFDESFSRITAEDFVKEILVNKFGIRLAVVGENYRFGYKGEGSTGMLKGLGRDFGFRVRVLPIFKIADEPISSTSIRRCLAKGYVKVVADQLGRYFSLKGAVEDGKKIGRTIGFPTANIHLGMWHAVPKVGVYITKTCYNGRYYSSITNVGYNPTFGESNAISVETYIFDFDEMIYQKEIEVFFIERIRGEIKFDSPDDLINQIKHDIEFAKNWNTGG